jgi:ribosome-binding protein aMBF1 (putative translation factor)
MKTMNIMICNMCGKECVRTSGAQKVCVDCRKKVKYDGYKRAKPKSAKKRERKQKALSISDICKLAKAEGLTYGQYVSKYGS